MQLFCLVCLSTNRKLHLIQDLTFFASLTLLKLSDKHSFSLCWECNAIMTKATNFRKKALKAQAILNDEEPRISLSTICQSNLVNSVHVTCQPTNDTPMFIEDEVKVEITQSDCPEDPLEESQMDTQDDCDVKSECDSDSDNETLSQLKKENVSYIKIQHETPRTNSVESTVVNASPAPKYITIAPKPNPFSAVQISPLENVTLEALVKRTLPARLNMKTCEVFSGPSQPLENKAAPKEKSKIIQEHLEKSDYILKEFTESELLERRREKLQELSEKKRKFQCETCILMFKNESGYISHMKKHAEEAGGFSCKICELRFETAAAMKIHEDAHYRTYECKICKAEFSSVLKFFRHFNVDHDGKAKKCSQCDESFPDDRTLYLHNRTHSLRVQCSICNKMIKSSLMKDHLERHIPQPHVECDICHKIYNGAASLEKHKRNVHMSDTDDAAAQYCAKCDVHFKNAMLYKLHLSQSTKHVRAEDLLKCPHCDKKFSCKSYVEGHIKRSHTNARFDCDQCDNTFQSKVSLRRHILKVHKKHQPSRDKVCEICGKAFFNTAILRQHMFSHQNIRPFKCEYCGDTFSYSGAKYTHVKLKHKQGNGKKKAK